MVNVILTDGRVEVALSGKIYAEEAANIRDQVFPCVGEGFMHYRFRMEDVLYIDSTGLGVLLALQKKVAKHGGEVRISGLRDELRKLFELTKLADLFRME